MEGQRWFLGWPDWSINSSPGSAEVRERGRGEQGKCADLPGESKKVWDCDGVSDGVFVSLRHSWLHLRLSVRTFCISREPEKER